MPRLARVTRYMYGDGNDEYGWSVECDAQSYDIYWDRPNAACIIAVWVPPRTPSMIVYNSLWTVHRFFVYSHLPRTESIAAAVAYHWNKRTFPMIDPEKDQKVCPVCGAAITNRVADDAGGSGITMTATGSCQECRLYSFDLSFGVCVDIVGRVKIKTTWETDEAGWEEATNKFIAAIAEAQRLRELARDSTLYMLLFPTPSAPPIDSYALSDCLRESDFPLNAEAVWTAN